MTPMRLLAAALLSAVLAASAGADAPTLKAGTFDPPRAAPDFTLRGSDGTDLSLGRYRGKVVILFFGYTHCPAVCPTTLGTLASAYKALGDEAKDLQVVYVTVDPERDDAKRLKEYLGAFDKTFVGGTGTEAQLSAVRKAYGISAQKIAEEKGGYKYGHSSFVYLIDRDGKLRALMPYGHQPEDYVHDLAILLAAKS